MPNTDLTYVYLIKVIILWLNYKNKIKLRNLGMKLRITKRMTEKSVSSMILSKENRGKRIEDREKYRNNKAKYKKKEEGYLEKLQERRNS